MRIKISKLRKKIEKLRIKVEQCKDTIRGESQLPDTLFSSPISNNLQSEILAPALSN